MTHLDLCSGIGGFALAASWVWPEHEVCAFVEIDPYCQAILARHFPGAPIHPDIRAFDARPLRGRVDLCTGGYPCQPFSHAGKRRGAADDRHLWPEVRRVVDECRPRWCLFENVAGHVTLGLDSVLSDLEAEGYAARPVVIPACAVDAPHRRDRVWVVAHADNGGRGRREGRAPEIHGRESEPHRSRAAVADAEGQPLWPRLRAGEPGGERRGRLGDGGSPHALAHAEGVDARYVDRGEPAAFGATTGGAESGGHPIPNRALWKPEPRVGRVADGVPRRVDRLRALGNAIVPQLAAEIMRAIKLADQ